MCSCPQAFACAYELEEAFAKEVLQLYRTDDAANDDAAADGAAWRVWCSADYGLLPTRLSDGRSGLK